MKIDKYNNNSFRVSQRFLIQRIFDAIPSIRDARSAKSPATTGTLLTKTRKVNREKRHGNIVRVSPNPNLMLNYLANSTHPELAFAVHQCTCFYNAPKSSHERAVNRIFQYLLHIQRTENQGIVFNPNASYSVDTFVDASFAGKWIASWGEEPSSVFSPTGYIVMFSKCLIIWASKLQFKITLSATESEYVAFSQVMRDVLPLVALLRELRSVIPFGENALVIHCIVHKNNKSCINLIKTPRIQPRTKHIALKYHHFRSHVRDETVSMRYVESSEQVTDIFTKALRDVQFEILRKMFMGW